MGKDKKQREPQYLPSPLSNAMLNYNVYYMGASEKILYALALLVLGGLVGLVFYGGLFKVDGEVTTATRVSDVIVFFLIGGITLKVFMPAVVEMLKNKRKKKLKQQFMNMMEALSTSLAAGTNLQDAVVNAHNDLLSQYDESELIIVELAEIINGMKNGKNLEEMISNFGIRSSDEDIMNFANVISNCYRLGGNFAEVVRHTRDIISEKFVVSDEIATKVSSNKLQLNVMCIMPVALVGMLKMSSSDFASNLGSFVGVLVTTISIGIFVASYLWGRKIIDIG